MRLYNGQVSVIADEILMSVLKEQDIEVLEENHGEVKTDIESVLYEWIRMDRELTDKARDMAARDSSISVGRAKNQLARRNRFKIGDEAISYITEQIIELFFHSSRVEEVFADDGVLRKRMRVIISRHTELDDNLDKEVRNKLKNLKEGSQTWDIEYQKVMSQLRHSKKLE